MQIPLSRYQATFLSKEMWSALRQMMYICAKIIISK